MTGFAVCRFRTADSFSALKNPALVMLHYVQDVRRLYIPSVFSYFNHQKVVDIRILIAHSCLAMPKNCSLAPKIAKKRKMSSRDSIQRRSDLQ